MRVLVTGSSGFIGSAVARVLVARGHEARCLVRATSARERLASFPHETAVGDVRDEASLVAATRGCDAIVHAAGIVNWNEIDSPDMDAVTVGGTRNVLSAARANGVSRVVYVSSVAAVNGSAAPEVFDESAEYRLSDARMHYARAKRRAEALCAEASDAGLHVTIVNPAEVYGPGDTNLVTAGTLVDFARESPVLVCHGGTSVVHLDDVALGIARAVEVGAPRERYILGGENLTLRELAALTLDLLGIEKRIVTVPNFAFKAATAAATALRIPLPYNPKVVPYATLYWFVDAGKATRDLGVTFRSARETLRPTLEWLRATARL